MDDLKIYDQAVSGFQKNLKTSKMPLHSWDLYSAFFSNQNNSLLDAKNLLALASQHKWNVQFEFQEELERDTVILVTNTKIEIVYASHNIIKMNGYKPEEVIGESPKMFQGTLTDRSITKKISQAITDKIAFETTVVNFHKDGSAYCCHIKGFPIFDKNKELSHFIAFERVA